MNHTLTTDDLQAIVETLILLIKAEGEATRKAIEEKIELNNSIHSILFEVELGTLKKEIIDAVKIRFQETAIQLKNGKERLEILEEHTGLKVHKN